MESKAGVKLLCGFVKGEDGRVDFSSAVPPEQALQMFSQVVEVLRRDALVQYLTEQGKKSSLVSVPQIIIPHDK